MRLVAGLVAFHALLLCAGACFLYPADLVDPRPRRIAASLGAAHLAGIAMTSLLLIALLTLGIGIGVGAFAIGAVLMSALAVCAGLLQGRRGALAAEALVHEPGSRPG